MKTYVQLYHRHYDQSAPHSIGTNIGMLVIGRFFAFIDSLLAFFGSDIYTTFTILLLYFHQVNRSGRPWTMANKVVTRVVQSEQ